MELSLRKARKLEKKIEAKLSGFKLTSEVNVRVRAKLEPEQLIVVENDFKDNVRSMNILNDIRFDIRQKVEDANFHGGICLLMNKREALISRKTLLEQVRISTLNWDLLKDTLESKLTSLLSGKDSYGDNTTVRTSVVTENTKKELFDNVIKDITLQLESIEEELIQKNSGLKVKLGADSVAFLKKFSLV
jgi:hypothetical protein